MAVDPVVCSDLVTVPGIKSIALRWKITDPHRDGLTYLRAEAVEVYASNTNDRAVASKIGEGWNSFDHGGVARAATWYYWIRARAQGTDHAGGGAPVYPWFPTGATSGVAATELRGSVLLTDPGYVVNESGFIEQWGTTTLGDGDNTLNFPLQFPTACLNMVAMAETASGVQTTPIRAINVSTPSTAGCHLFSKTIEPGGQFSSGAFKVYWRAIGY